MKRILSLLIAVSLSITAAADFQKIHFTDDGTADGTPLAPGFTMNSCWGAITYAHNRSVYVAISNHTTNSGNVALFRYDTDYVTMHYLGDIKSISQAAGNWKSNDTHYKIHSQLPQHADGTIYMTTQEDANPAFLGAHMYTLTGRDTVTDYTATSSWYLDDNMNTQAGIPGHLTAERGVIALGVNPRVPDVTYGLTYPDGYLFLHNPQTGKIKMLVKTISGSSDYINRYIGVDNDGNAYIAKNLENETEQIYKFRLSDSTWYAIGSPFAETGSHAKWGGFVSQVPTASGDTLYGQTFDGQVIRVVYPTESVEIVGDNMPAASFADHNMAISKDGNHLYSLHLGWMPPSYSTPGMRFFDYNIQTAQYERSDFIPLYDNYGLVKGMHTADTYGNIYFVGWTNATSGFDNIALFKINPGAGLVEPNPPLSVWGVNGIEDNLPQQPEPVRITDAGVWPSPFITRTVIGFRATGDASVGIYNMDGQEIRRLASPGYEVKYRTVSWDGTDRFGKEVQKGMYIYRITAGQHMDGGMVFKAK